MPPQTEFQRKSSCLTWFILFAIVVAAIISLCTSGCTASVGTAVQTVEEDRAEWEQRILVREKESIQVDDYLFLVEGYVYERETINPSFDGISCTPHWKAGELKGEQVDVTQVTVVTINRYDDYTAVKIRLQDGCQGWVSEAFLFAADS